MAYTYSWTALSLPQVPQKGFSENHGALVQRTSMDKGPAKMRYLGKRPSQLNVSFIMTNAEVATLKNFVENTIRGTIRFGFPHPRTNTIEEVRIIPQGDSLFTTSYLAPGYWTVSLQLEVLP